MRRALIVLVVLAVGLLLWLVLGSGGETGGPDGGPESASSTEDDGAAGRKRGQRRRIEEEEEQAAVVEARTPFLAAWPEIGQGTEQDPALASLAGRVMLAPEAPAFEAVVEAVRSGVEVARVHAGDDGRFHMKNVPPGSGLSLVARAPDHGPGGIGRISLRKGQHLDVGVFYVGAALDPTVDNRLTVEVVGPDGQPVAGAGIAVTTMFYGALVTLGPYERQPGATVIRKTADGSGRATFEKIPPGSYDVMAEAEGLTFDVRQRYTVQRTTKAKLKLKLAAGASIAGKVVNAAGEPVVGALVGCMQWGTFKNFPATASGENGSFALTGLSPGNYFVFAGDEKNGAKDLRNVKPGDKDLVITLESGGELVIRVTDEETGEPIRAFSVRPYRNTPFAYLFAASFEVKDDDGVFRMTFPESSYGVEVSAPGYALFKAPKVGLTPIAAQEGEGAAPEPFPVAMKRAAAVVGKVVSRATGLPIAGAKIYVKRGGLPPTPYKDLQTVSDGDGRFTLPGMAPDPINLWVSHVDHSEQSFDGIVPAVAVEGVPAEPVVFELGSGGTIEGRVYDDNAVPAEGQTLTLTTSGFDFSLNRSTEAGAHGVYRFSNVPPGPSYTVAVGAFIPGQSGRSRSGINVEEGQVTTVDFGLAQGGQTLTGVVLRDGVPAKNASVSLVSDGGTGAVIQERTDETGRFTFEQVAPGKYQVTATAGRRRSVAVEVKPDEPTAEIEIVLVASGISGTVVDAVSGAPVDGAFVQCERVVKDAGSSLASVVQGYKGDSVTRADGTFEFKGLEGGVYRLRVSHDNHGAEISDDVTLDEGQSLPGMRIALGATATLVGRVRTPSGTPVSEANLQLVDERGRAVFYVSRTQSSSDGSFNQAGLKPGTYTLTFEKPGFAPSSQTIAITADGVNDVDVEMRQGGRLRVSVLVPGGSPVEGASIRLEDAQGKPVTKGLSLSDLFSAGGNRTGADGVATIRGIAPGVYRAIVTQGGVTVRSDAVEVFEGGETPVELVLAGQE